jgi:hypothetical protein
VLAAGSHEVDGGDVTGATRVTFHQFQISLHGGGAGPGLVSPAAGLILGSRPVSSPPMVSCSYIPPTFPLSSPPSQPTSPVAPGLHPIWGGFDQVETILAEAHSPLWGALQCPTPSGGRVDPVINSAVPRPSPPVPVHNDQPHCRGARQLSSAFISLFRRFTPLCLWISGCGRRTRIRGRNRPRSRRRDWHRAPCISFWPQVTVDVSGTLDAPHLGHTSKLSSPPLPAL